MFTHSPSDRMQLVGMGDLLHPGCCIVCGNGTCEKGYIKLDVSFEFEGEGYLCYYCTVQAGEILGMMIPEEVKILKDHNDKLNQLATAYKTQLDAANDRLSSYDTIMRTLGTVSVLGPDGTTISMGPQQITTDFSDSTDGSDSGVEGQSAELAESTKGSDAGRRSSVKLSDTQPEPEPASIL